MPFETAVTAIISALLSAGGVSAIMRTRGQNKTDATAALNSGQVAFNTALAQRVKDLEAANERQAAAQAIQDERYDKMIEANAQLGASAMIKDNIIQTRDETIARQVSQLTALGLELDELKRDNKDLSHRVAVLETQAEGRIHGK